MSSDVGWIKIHRALLKGTTWQRLTGEQAKAMIGLLLQVNFEPARWTCPKCGDVLDVPAGGTCKTIRTLAEDASVSRGTMERTMNHLGRAHAAHSTHTRRCHRIYVFKNWDKYQAPGTAVGQPWDNRGTTVGHIKEREEGKERKEPTSGRAKPSRPKAKKKKDPANKRAVAVLQDYYDQYSALHGTPPVGIKWQGRDLQIAKNLLAGPPPLAPSDLHDMVGKFIRLKEPFVRDKGWPFYLIESQASALTQKNTKAPVAVDWDPE